MEFSRQEYWNGLPFPIPGNLSDSAIKPGSFLSPALAGRFFTTTQPRKPKRKLFSLSVMSNSLRPHGLQHARLLCPSPSPRACSNSCPLSQCCHLILCRPLLLPSSFPASGSFQMSQFFASVGQSIGASASTSVLPIEHSGLISFRIDWFDLLAVQGTLKSLLQHHSSKATILQRSAFFMVQLSLLYMTTGKTMV